MSQSRHSFEVLSQGLLQSNSIAVGSRYCPCIWQLRIGWFFHRDPSPPSPGFTGIFRNIIQLSASGYNRGHVSPVKVKHRHKASPVPFQTPRSTLDCQPAAAQLVIKLLLTAAWISMVWLYEPGEEGGSQVLKSLLAFQYLAPGHCRLGTKFLQRFWDGSVGGECL